MTAEKLPVVEIVEILPTRVWFDKDFMGTVHVWMQHEGDKPFDFIQMQYSYAYTSNGHQHGLAERIVSMLQGTDEDAASARIAELDRENEALRKDAALLDSNCIVMHHRDEFGDEYDVEHRGVNLRVAISKAIELSQRDAAISAKEGGK